MTQLNELIELARDNTTKLVRTLRVAAVVLLAALAAATLLGVLHVLDSIPLLGNMLDLVAVYYIYGDRARVGKLISKTYNQLINPSLLGSLPPSDTDV